ncbi:MAG TPA: LPS-assembly protein LptD [Usitatibacter sp.]|nr:LPS-assembly protein LptD [Usitatibacter sp.]
MRPARIRTLTIALICGFSHEVAGADAETFRLQIEKQLHLAPTRPERDSAKFLEADQIEGEPDQKIVATGNVILRQRGASIRADRLEYSQQDQKAVATGHVKLERNGDAATGPRLDYDMSEDRGHMDSPVFEFPKTAERKSSSRGQAASADLSQNQVNVLHSAEYTSCPAPRDDWFLRVHELLIDSSRNVGTAYNSTLYFLGMPILYTPYMTFPLDNKRKSGFLSPTFGTSGKSGFEMALPYYWNIADNFDATATPKIYTKRGLQLGGEFRYLEPTFNGELVGEILPHDRIAEIDRYFVGLRHSQALWGGWNAAINAQKVSDDNYFRDLSTRIAATSQTNLPRDAIVAFQDDVWALSARALAYQTLQDPLNPGAIPIPYRIVPRLAASGLKQNVAGFLDWQVYSEYSNFRHPTLVSGQRVIVYPSVDIPFRRSWGYVVPKVGVDFTQYKLDQSTGDDSPSRTLPIASIDSGLFFDRSTTWGGRAFEQTLEPRLYYLYVPFKDQGNLPNFTTAEADINFAQLFRENRFVGGDRIGDANQVTLAVTTKLIESSTGLERFRGSLGQTYFFRPPRVTLTGTSDTDTKNSDIVAVASSQMAPTVSVDMGIQYTPNLSRSQRLAFQTQWMPDPGKILNLAYRYTRGDPLATDPSLRGIKQVDVSSQWPITSTITGLGRIDWSTQERKVLEGLAGFEYNAGCWQLRAVAHRFITSAQQYSTSFQIQLELTGLSRIGINPFETIRRNISGYRRADEISP